MNKLVQLLSNFIPNKEKRHNFRERYNKKIFDKNVEYINSEEGQKRLKQIENEYPNVLSTTETLNEIINNGKSISRFGDGEYNLLMKGRKKGNIFQKKNKKLKLRLEEILNSKKDNILICISPIKSKGNYHENPEFKKKFGYFMEMYWLANWEELKEILKNDNYGNALISRKDVFNENQLENIKQIWNNKDIVFVYSKTGRFEKDDRLFNNIKSFEEIFIPALNAFDKYDDILKECLTKEKNKLFLIAGGPTATILAYDLSNLGYQALDIGHLPNCYKEYLGEILTPEILPREKGE